MMKPRHSRLYLAQIVLLLACGLLTAPARAQIIFGTCTAGASGVAFGTYNLLSATPLTSTGTVTVNCSNAFVLGNNTVTIDLSTGQSGIYTTRSLGTGFSYNLYQDAAHTQIWGNGTGGSTQYSGTLTTGQTTLTATVYAEIPALQNPAPGSYTDTITVTVNY
jgi:spore coat protein U-like protein